MKRRSFLRSTLALGALGATGCCFLPSELEAPIPSAPSTVPPTTSAVLASPAPTEWVPAQTVVLAVGILRWARADLYDAMPAEERRDQALVEALVARGVPRSRITYLVDEQATLARAREALAASIAACGPDDTFVFYWAGHGDRTDAGASYAVPFDAGDDSARTCLGYDEIARAIERGGMGRALSFADTCYSGALADALVARRGGPMRAGFGASSASESSTGNWTFTDAVIAAFGGDANADRDRDGSVTLTDLERFVEEEMAFADGQLANVQCTSDFPRTFRLAGAAAPPCVRYGERLEVLDEGTWWPATIIGQPGTQLAVHYDGYTGSSDAVVDVSQTRPYAPLTYAAGTRVEVRWEGQWYPAAIRDQRLGVHLVHYDGFADTWDEWVSSDRIRVPT
ncbi:MAG: caspase family protein [Sandaracinus sp.]